MRIPEEIKKGAKKAHDELTRRYYVLHELDKEEFDRLHAQIWKDMDDELMTLGYIEKGRNWKEEYSQADTLTERLDIIAERIKLK